MSKSFIHWTYCKNYPYVKYLLKNIMNRESEIEKIEQEQRELAAKQQELAERVAKLKSEPEKPEPKAGQVWQHDSGHLFLLLPNNRSAWIPVEQEYFSESGYDHRIITEFATYIGMHNEVFVRKDQVIEALSIEDGDVDSVLRGDRSLCGALGLLTI